MANYILVLLAILAVTRTTVTESSIQWKSTYSNDTFFCSLVNAPVRTDPGRYVYHSCYIPNEQDAVITFTKRRISLKPSSAFLPPYVRLTFSEPNTTRCIVCERNGDNMNTCLACKDASLTANDAEHRPEFIQSGVEIHGDDKIFFCRFRIQPNSTTIDSAWLNERCIFNKDTKDPVEACSSTASYINPPKHKKYMTITAKARTGDVCRVCMIRANKQAVTVARACIDQRYELYNRDVRVGAIVVIVVYVVSIGILGIGILWSLYREESVRRFFKKMFGVRMDTVQVTIIGLLVATINCDIVTVSVPDSTNADIVKAYDVLLSGLELCYGTRFIHQEEIDVFLKR